MAIDSNALKNKAAGVLNNFSMGQKAVIVIAVVTLVVGGVFFTQWASKPTMSPLFSNLSSQEEAGEITSKLQSKGIKYEIEDGGKTILVPDADVYQTRMDLAAEGLPAGGSEGYKLLDEQGITTSEFRERIDYQRALEGEISKTISAMNGVQAATVRLVIPKEDVFAADAKKPSASIMVKTAPGKSLAGGQVQAIVNLVASSVEGLTPDSVTVADASGKLLAAPGQQGASTGNNEAETQATTNLESDVSRKIQTMLDPVVGSGKALVQAKAQLNFDQTKSTAEVWNPNNKPASASSEKITEENYANGAPGATGVLGPNGVPLNQGANGGGSYTKTDTARDLVNDRTVTQTEKAPGSVDRLSVAVVLDSNVPGVDPIEIQKIVTDAAGLQPARGDTVTVSRLPFDQSQAKADAEDLKAAETAKKKEEQMNLIKSVATVVIILAVLGILFFLTKRKAKGYAPTPISMAELESAMAPSALPEGQSGFALESPTRANALPSAEQLEKQKVDSEITDLIERQPDEVAGLLRSWLADRRG